MVKEIRIYVEGGGDSRDGKASVREGFSRFLDPLRQLARSRNIRWNIIACGGRNKAFDAFQAARRQHSTAFNILLVDSEGPVSGSICDYLLRRDNWEDIREVPDNQCHLMVQNVETWIVSDIETLSNFYGQNFNQNCIPQDNLEQIDKNTIKNALENATRSTQKGKYHKIDHGPKLLGRANPAIVRQKAAYCERLFGTVQSIINPS